MQSGRRTASWIRSSTNRNNTRSAYRKTTNYTVIQLGQNRLEGIKQQTRTISPEPSNSRDNHMCRHRQIYGRITKAITRAVEETTPRKRPSPHSKRWWNDNIGILRQEANRLRNIYGRTKSNIDKV